MSFASAVTPFFFSVANLPSCGLDGTHQVSRHVGMVCLLCILHAFSVTLPRIYLFFSRSSCVACSTVVQNGSHRVRGQLFLVLREMRHRVNTSNVLEIVGTWSVMQKMRFFRAHSIMQSTALRLQLGILNLQQFRPSRFTKTSLIFQVTVVCESSH